MEEIISPPFPVDTTTIPRLLQHFKDLREWVLEMRYWANENSAELGVDQELIPSEDKIPRVPDVEHYRLIAVTDIARSYVTMRHLRESWDALVRTYEENWDVKPAVLWRLNCVQTGLAILQRAFLTPEMREAQEEAMQNKVCRITKAMLKRMGIPKKFRDSIVFGPAGMMFDMSKIQSGEGDSSDQAQDGFNQEELDRLFNGWSEKEGQGDDAQEGDSDEPGENPVA